MTDYVITGGRSPSYPLKHYGAHFVGTRATFCLDADLAAMDANTLAIPNLTVSVLSASPVSVADSFFGMHVYTRANDSVSGLTFKTVRSHDLTGGKARWAKIQPTDTQNLANWDFVDLDAWVNTHYAAGRDLVFTLFGTPSWAAGAKSAEEGIYGPSNLGMQAEPADMTDWTFYCATIATRYLGKIKYYEVWNEPNMNNDGTGVTATGISNKRFFYSGTFAKLAEMTRLANQTIKAIDPTAKIISAPIQGWQASGTNDSGAYLTGMMAAATGDGSTTMKSWVDIVGVHLYLPSTNDTTKLAGIIDRVNTAKTSAGVSAKETWDTESAPIGGDAVTLTDVQVQAITGRMLVTMAAKGIARTMYYQYDHPTMGVAGRQGIITFMELLQARLKSGVLAVNRFADGRVSYSTSSGVTII